MAQEIIILLLVVAATGYLINIVRKSFSLKNGACPKGCGCSQIDIKKMEKELKAIEVFNTKK